MGNARSRLAAIALGLALALWAPARADDTRLGDTALWRATFVVADMDKALAVWRDVLGFTVAYTGGSTLDDPRLTALFGLKAGEKAQLQVLISGNSALGNIGFLKPEGRVARPPRGRVASGGPAVFIKTTKLDAQVPALIAAGCTLIAGPEAGAPGRTRMAWFIDPNGVRFVLTERTTIETTYPNR
jgi:catechol 2,3-dioxygenase-like lactoylglutathione lyase family enzyme